MVQSLDCCRKLRMMRLVTRSIWWLLHLIPFATAASAGSGVPCSHPQFDCLNASADSRMRQIGGVLHEKDMKVILWEAEDNPLSRTRRTNQAPCDCMNRCLGLGSGWMRNDGGRRRCHLGGALSRPANRPHALDEHSLIASIQPSAQP